MGALSYLFITRMKNKLLSLKKKPAFVIMYGVLLVIVILSFVAIMFAREEGEIIGGADERYIFLFIAGFGFLYLFTFIMTGLSTGSTLFTMSDVALLFVAPISPKKILNYGLVSSLGKTLLTSIFIFYQLGNLKVNFGYGFREIMALFIIYAIMIFFFQILSIAVYIYTNQNEKRKKAVKYALYLSFLAFILIVISYQKQQSMNILEALMSVVDSKFFGYVPVAGWSVMFFKGAVDGVLFSILLPLIFFLVFIVLGISLLSLGKADYYEDVLLSTEYTHKAEQAVKEGGNYQRKPMKRIKVNEQDHKRIKGKGAVVFAYKHILEMRRGSRFILVDGYTFYIAIVVTIAGFNFKGPAAAYGILAFIIYHQYFTTVFGMLKQELIKHYIFLIPEKSTRKVFYASVSSMLKHFVDAVFLFAGMLISGITDPANCFFLALTYIASGIVFVSMTILFQRVLGGQPGMTAKIIIGMLLMIVILTPAVVASAFTGIYLPEQLRFLSTMPYIIYCILISLLIFRVCGNLIDKSEFSSKL
ncbi:putative ABC exporter domain-containing protein [Mobilitalea sibirica]|uniref:Putative ABC exporter domain-containing protein n=1 Tax=Mobilitalea sibirica TaxID=1462919 RepID=A0A8J7H4E5_9FIRM|nr:putative ABC exporter domain-containing protein [Mobilitalea sibirica]MBH1942298.1 putative ABC exporter domain-containing protein [Mobilitalea sibirica]